MHTLHCIEHHREYDLIIQANCITDGSITQACRSLANHFIILCDPRISQQYAQPIYQQLHQENITCTLIELPAGEKHKTRETKQNIEDQMLKLGCGRDTAIIAIGGGVTTDMAGFIAATYCRGIPSIYVPTTLLAMVDASIGGKTAVNTPLGKNLIGSFHSPAQVFCDPTTLTTLQPDQLLDGLAETIKHALIKDAELFNKLEHILNQTNIPSITTDQWETIIYNSCLIKRDVVKDDALEQKGPRQLLNFGHTIAHSIEQFTHFKHSHGQAVMIGIYVESYLSLLNNHLSQEDFDKIHSLILKLSYSRPIQFNQNNINELIASMAIDKKSINSIPRFIFIEKIGQSLTKNNQYSHTCSDKYIKQGLLKWIKGLNQ